MSLKEQKTDPGAGPEPETARERGRQSEAGAQDETKNGAADAESSGELGEASPQTRAAGEKQEAGPPDEEPTEAEAARKTAEETYDRFLRLQAEFENYKKRQAKERAETLKYASVPLLKDFLNIQDNLARATEHARKNGGEGMEAILSGVEMVSKQINEIFERHGLKRIEALGKPFDPTLHEAMGVVETGEAPENQVMEEFQAGYTLHDRVVRPAMVMVSKRGQADGESRPSEQQQENREN